MGARSLSTQDDPTQDDPTQGDRTQGEHADSRRAWVERYAAVRAHTLYLAKDLSAEDQQVQSMDDVSPTKWHLAHATWFFETFLLEAHRPGYAPFDARYGFLFNSYYEAVGPRHPRSSRGLLSRPSIAEIHAYRSHVDVAMAELIETADLDAWTRVEALLELGLNHEQQHQELQLMDIKHVFSANPLLPAYARATPAPIAAAEPARAPGWVRFEGGLVEIGADDAGFAFDNERPRHKAWLEPFALCDRLVTVGEWIAFIEDGGYRRPELWLSDGWAAVAREGWQAPLYWRRAPEDAGAGWRIFTLEGERPAAAAEPVSHVSFYEADAFARWAGRRLPTEAEWETAAARERPAADAPALHPKLAGTEPGLRQMLGALWQWTASPYTPYPGFRVAEGAVGEYNGKFMSGQMVLRGGACATPARHARTTYRNFFPPAARWCFGGLRLADDA